MQKGTVILKNPLGLNIGPAGVLCDKAGEFKCKIKFVCGNSEANAKSVLSVLGACVKYNSELTFYCDGEDEEEALKAMIEVVENNLN